MSLTVLLPFLVTCLIIEITPGPNMAYLAVLSASEGAVRRIRTSLS